MIFKLSSGLETSVYFFMQASCLFPPEINNTVGARCAPVSLSIYDLGTTSFIASLTSSIHSASVSPLPSSSHRLFQKLLASSMLVNVQLLTCVSSVSLSYSGLSISAWLSNIFPKVAYILPGSAQNFWLSF